MTHEAKLRRRRQSNREENIEGLLEDMREIMNERSIGILGSTCEKRTKFIDA
jgi:hypothetical protein